MDTRAWLIILRLENSLRARKYSPATRRRYLGFCQRLFQRYPTMEPAELGTVQLEAFLADLERQGRSASCINQAISAFSYLWANILALPFPITARPRADQVLPRVLSPGQVESLIRGAQNPRDRLAFALAYSAGLRVSEVAKLRIHDIDRQRMTMLVRQGKGRKDRILPLSRRVCAMLESWLDQQTSVYVFPGDENGHIPVRELQRAMEKARKRAKLPDFVTMHTLRHSYATHLVERGENLMTVKDLMGHQSLATLQRYVHCAAVSSGAPESPFDTPPHAVVKGK